MGTTRTCPRASSGKLLIASALILSALVCVPVFSQPPGKDAKPSAKLPLDKLTTGELIDKLQEESEQGIGTLPFSWASGFLAVDEEPKFRGGILGSEKPAASPVLRESVRRGLGALPMLLEHVDDKRPTKLVIEHSGAMWHSDEYDPRHTDPKKWPAKVNTDRDLLGAKARIETKYPVRVGDLCFVAVGQIVNRELYVVRYQPTLCIIMPVEFSAGEAVQRTGLPDGRPA